MTRNEFLVQLYKGFDEIPSFSYFAKSPFYLDDEVGDIDIETKSVKHGELCLDRLVSDKKLQHFKRYYYTFGASQPSLKYFIWCETWRSCVQIDFFAGYYVYGQEIEIENSTDLDKYKSYKNLAYHNQIFKENEHLVKDLYRNKLFLLLHFATSARNQYARFILRMFVLTMLALKTVVRALYNIKIVKVIAYKLSSKFAGPQVICFVGLDGAGKTTLIRGLLKNALIKEYYGDAVAVWHTRPKVLPRLGAIRLSHNKNMLSSKRNTRPHSPIKVSIIALHAFVDFKVGYLYAWLIGKKLCISDRGIPEFLYQPEFSKAPKYTRALCEHQLKKQHLFAIVCGESILATRKADLNRDEIALTMEHLERFKKRSQKLGLNFEVIDTSISPSKISVIDILRRLKL
jgi:hypothetical protein